MSPVEKQSLELILTEEFSTVIERVFEEIANGDREEIDIPWVGDNTSYWMAKAAVAAIMAIADSQKYLKNEGMLSE